MEQRSPTVSHCVISIVNAAQYCCIVNTLYGKVKCTIVQAQTVRLIGGVEV
jgi:hypothetical protein